MLKNFIKERSKIHFLIVLSSLVLFFIGILPELLNYSVCVRDFSLSYAEGIDTNLTTEQIHLALLSTDIANFISTHTILLTCFMFISIIFNITSYLYKKLELLFISIFFIVLIMLINIFSFDTVGILIFILIIIINILAYLEQHKINKTKIKS